MNTHKTQTYNQCYVILINILSHFCSPDARPSEVGRQGRLEPPHFLCLPFDIILLLLLLLWHMRVRTCARSVCQSQHMHAKQLVLIQQVCQSR